MVHIHRHSEYVLTVITNQGILYAEQFKKKLCPGSKQVVTQL